MSAPDIPPHLIKDVAGKLLGEPNQRRSTKSDIRYGNHGSLSVDIKTGTWYDHEAQNGGGILDLIERETGTKGQKRWDKLAELTGYRPEEKPPGKPNGKSHTRAKVAAVYDYADADGILRYQVCRMEPKDFRQRQPHPAKPGEWVWNMDGVTAIPYRLPQVIKAIKRGDVIVLVEGEKDADSLARLGIEASCNHGGAKKWRHELTPHFRGADIVLIGDNDQVGRDHIEVIGGALAGIAHSVRAIDIAAAWPECPPKGDVSDWIAAGATLETILGAIEDAAPWCPAQEPEGNEASERQGAFILVRRATDRLQPGVYYVDPDDEDDDGKPRWVCSQLEPLAYTRDRDNRNWGRLLEIVDHDGIRHVWSMPAKIGPTVSDGADFRRELVDRGLKIAAGHKARNRLNDYVTIWQPRRKVRCVATVGWCGDAFVMPDKTFGGAETIILQTEGVAPEFSLAGSIEEWREAIAAYCAGNSRLAFALSAAFAGPLLKLAGEESGGIHFRGSSSIGKTTMLHVARSVWGTQLGSWRTTDNAAEAIAAGACDALLTLDEIGQASPRVVGELAYMLGNERGKGRMHKNATARATHRWRILFLSTGEIGMAARLMEGGDKARAGQEVRVLEVAANAGAGLGVFENLHGFRNAAMLAEHFRRMAERACGHASRAFLDAITESPSDLAATVSESRAAFIAENCPAEADGQVRRACGRFAIVAIAGELATQIGITGWQPGEAKAAAVRCWQDWLAERGGIGSAENREALLQVRFFLEQHGESRFDPAWSVQNGRTVLNRAGFRKGGDGEGWTYYVMQEAWRREICKGFDPHAVASEMVKKGWMTPGEDDQHTARSERIPGHKRMRVYVITPDFMGDIDIDKRHTQSCFEGM